MNYYFISLYLVNFLLFRKKSKDINACSCSMKESLSKMNLFFNPIQLVLYDKFLNFMAINKDSHYILITQGYISFFFLYLYSNHVYTCKNCDENIDFNNYITEIKIDEERTCHICLEGFNSMNKPFSLTFCDNKKHPFHKECIEQMFKYSKICPICKN